MYAAERRGTRKVFTQEWKEREKGMQEWMVEMNKRRYEEMVRHTVKRM